MEEETSLHQSPRQSELVTEDCVGGVGVLGHKAACVRRPPPFSGFK